MLGWGRTGKQCLLPDLQHASFGAMGSCLDAGMLHVASAVLARY